MIPNPIRKVLSSIRANEVQALLMGGQACVLYGAAEFSRDADFAVLVEPGNLKRLRGALEELDAVCIAVPPFEPEFLERGHAVHFRCRHAEASGMRIDVMAKMRGVDSFAELWVRRSTFLLEDGLEVDLLALPDLVKAKKTQRDKDWPMIRRLLEVDYFANRDEPDPAQVGFWLRELRTPELVIEVATRFPNEARSIGASRLGVRRAIERAATTEVVEALKDEEQRERVEDALYWEPLRAELSRLRRDRLRGPEEA